MKTKNLLNRILAVLSVFIIMLFVGFESTLSISAKAEENTYSNVLDDLRKDESFDISDYPSDYNSKEIRLLQIAESENDELFVYIYQAGYAQYHFTFSGIRIATLALGIDCTYVDYELNLVSEVDVFGKYLVEGFTVPTDSERYYNIVQIERPFDENFDTAPENGNTASTVPYEIAQRWKVVDNGDSVDYLMEDTEVVTITNKFLGYVRYTDHFLWFDDNTDSHFVAFSTDKKIDDLVEIDITYFTNVYVNYVDYFYPANNKESCVGYPSDLITINSEDYGKANSFFGEGYSWKRIEKTSDFLTYAQNSGYTLTSNGIGSLEQTEWILRFAETPYIDEFEKGYSPLDGLPATTGHYVEYHTVTDVSILRLKFRTNGITYNLGVVDNKQSGSDVPIGGKDYNSFLEELEELFNNFVGIMKGVIGIFVVILGVGVLVFALWLFASVLRFIGGTIKKIFKRKK